MKQYASKKHDLDFQAENRRRANEYYHLHRDEIRAQAKRDYAANPFKYLSYGHNRRLLLVCDNPYTKEDIADILRMQRGRCALCRKLLRKDVTVDHIIPVSKGGSNDRRNIQLAHLKCNMQKHARDQIDFMRSLGRLL